MNMKKRRDKALTMLENAVALAVISLAAMTVFLSVSAALRASALSQKQMNINRFEASLKMCSYSENSEETLEFYLGKQISEGKSFLYLDDSLCVCESQNSSYILEIDNGSGNIRLVLLENDSDKPSFSLDLNKG